MFLGFLLPVCLAWLLFDLLRRLKLATDLREILLIESVILGASVVISTEILNAFQALTFNGVVGAGVLECIGVHFYRMRLRRPEPLKLISRVRVFFREAGWDSLVMSGALAIFVVVLLLVGFFATPNNYDSMTYHLARIAHWQQDNSINFYGTNIPRQNFMPPWAEWLMLQLTLLQGDDRLVNLVQGVCYIGCMVGASFITELFGGNRRAGIIAAFFVGTLPAATFEATSTQNDLVMSFWLICIVYGCVKLTLQPGWLGALIFAASLGLAMMTKTVTMIFAAPLCLWAGWALVRHGLAKSIPQLALIAVAALALNAGHLTRNVVTAGHLLGPEEHDQVGSHYTNDIHTPGAIFSNILRNASLHANVFHQKAWAEQTVINILRGLGIDPQDPRTTFNGGVYSIWEGGEDGAPMPFHLVVIGLSFIALIWYRRRFTFLPVALALSVLTGALLFCIILKWQPFHARLHLALFIMAAPFVGLVMGGLFWRYFSLPVLALFLLTTVPNVFWYPPRAALGPISVFTTQDDFQQLFRQSQLATAYLQTKQFIDHYKFHEVGLIWKEDDWEFPLLFTQHVAVPWRVDHVMIQNAYSPLETTLVPDVVLCTRPGFGPNITVHNQKYHMVQSFVQGDAHDLILSVYVSDSFTPNASP